MIKNMIKTKKTPTHFIIELNGERIIAEEIELGTLVMDKKNEIILVFSADKPTIFCDLKNKKTICIYLE